MVSTICIYIKSNEYFSHIHALCWRNMKETKKSFLIDECSHVQARSLCKKQHLLLSYSKPRSVADFQSAGDVGEKP